LIPSISPFPNLSLTVRRDFQHDPEQVGGARLGLHSSSAVSRVPHDRPSSVGYGGIGHSLSGRAVSGPIHVPELPMPKISVAGNQCLHTSFEGGTCGGCTEKSATPATRNRAGSPLWCAAQKHFYILVRLPSLSAWGWNAGCHRPLLGASDVCETVCRPRAIDLTHPCGIRHKSSPTPPPSCLSVAV
jgi:hypothetical protein